MNRYNAVNGTVVAALKGIVGEKYVWTDPEKMEAYAHDGVTGADYASMPEVVVRPRTAEEVAAVVKLANAELIPIVPRGGGTGLACGAVPFGGGIVLSTERMNEILEVDEDNMVLLAEAGVPVSAIQRAASERGLIYAGDPSSGDSAFIGGNVATNAGGSKTVKYGTTRQQVMGLELVTPEGDIVTLGGKLRKDSTGYCLTQLIAGAEGTLGIVTKVLVKMMPKAKFSTDLLAVFPDLDSAIGVVPKIFKSGIIPVSVEFIDNPGLRTVENFLKMTLPHSDKGNYIIVALEGETESVLEDQCLVINELCMTGGAMEVLVANSAKIWKARKCFTEASRARSLIYTSEDVVVPVASVADVVKKMVEVGKAVGITVHCCGHAGDGNVHADILKDDMDLHEWKTKLERLRKEIYEYVYSIGGKLSGEHGIGYKRRDYLEEFANPVELKMMKAIKQAIDPKWILNPGKVFRAE